jgi:hypothetical protein
MKFCVLLLLSLMNLYFLITLKHEMVVLQENTKTPVFYEVATEYVIINSEDNWDVKTLAKEE